MSALCLPNSVPSVLSNNSKIISLETTLQQSIANFRDLLLDFEQLHMELETYKTKFITQFKKCESKGCTSSEALKKIIESKDHIIQLVASTLTRLNETKDFNLLNEAFKILFGETTVVLNQEEDVKNIKTELTSAKKDLNTSLEDVSLKDESMSEIEGTPGRTSPIIQTKKLKNSIALECRDKKKCPQNWPTPENKSIKLTYPTGTPTRGKSGRLKQARLNLVPIKQTNVVDLTSSPEFSGGCRTGRNDVDCIVQPLIKKESMENDDTILPSPTSGPNNFGLFISKKDSPMKFKKPLSLKNKIDNIRQPNCKLDTQNNENTCEEETKHNEYIDAEDSINILNPNRLSNNIIKHSPIKQERHNDTTYCDTQSSVSVLQHINKLEDIHGHKCSPTKQPLVENININNIPPNEELESSISLLQTEHKTNTVNNVKRKIPELVEVVYKEPAPRKKAEKRMLPGWSCDECKHFFGELYKDDPEMYARKIEECSKHRGNHNPARPATPPGFWNPRWEVPDDTEEFNRKNNA